MELLRKKGWTVIRSAGSHQAIDLIASKRTRGILAIQCKTNEARFTTIDCDALQLAADAFSALSILAERRGRKHQFTAIPLNGPRDLLKETWFD